MSDVLRGVIALGDYRYNSLYTNNDGCLKNRARMLTLETLKLLPYLPVVIVICRDEF